MEIIIGAIVFGLIIIAIIVMLVINFTYRGVKKLREQAEDNYYRKEKEKEKKEKHPFGKDYFKSANTKKQQTARPNKPKTEKPKMEKPKVEKPKEEAPQQEKETARRTVTTDSNVKIFDEREANDKRKIFDDKDGEYVEFEEVRG